MAMRDSHFQPGHKFGEMLRKRKAEAHGDRTMRGEARPKTGMEAMPEEERGGSAGNRQGKQPKAKGKFRSIRIEPSHAFVDGKKKVVHTIHVEHHQPKHKGGSGPMPPYKEPSKHVHTNIEDAKNHVASLMDGLEPDADDEPDSRDMAASLY